MKNECIINKKWSLLIGCIVLSTVLIAQYDTISYTNTIGDIPTSYQQYDQACEATTLSNRIRINWPSNGLFFVDSVEISYDMTAGSSGWLSDQRSQIYCANRQSVTEVYEGVGDIDGTYSYNHEGLLLANGGYDSTYPLDLDMRAWRTYGVTPDCGTNYNKVDSATWGVKVYYYKCPPTDAVISSQAELDAFILTYGDCLDRGFPLTIENCHDLSGLSFIDTIIELTIRNNPELATLSGLENLIYVGVLTIENNDSLHDVTPLSNLVGVGELYIQENDQLLNLDGLANVSGYTNLLYLLNNNNLVNIQGLSGIDTVFEAVVIQNNQLISLDGFSPSCVEWAIRIYENPSLTSLSTFSFNSIDVLEIINNPVLTSLGGLESLTTVSGLEGNVFIFGNPIGNLQGLENLATVTGALLIHGTAIINLQGLDGLRYAKSISLYQNEQLTDISQLVINISEIENSLEIRGSNLLENCCILYDLRPRIYGEIILVGNGSGCSSWTNLRAYCQSEDPDNDLLINSLDNCDSIANPLQEDADMDGVGNACDNCPLVSNPLQTDNDNDFIGDACESSVVENSILDSYGLILRDTHMGIIMTNANDDCYRIHVDLEGKLVATEIDCPD